jgi:alpha-ketoglutarate-dependent taurine dioxygenase
MEPASYRSFGEQALHYFRREHEGVAPGPIAGPAAWRGAELAGCSDWIVSLAPAQIDELERARAAARATGRPLAALRREDFPLPGLAPAIAGWARELAEGRGFLLVRGLPVERWGDDDSALVFWGLGLHPGWPGAQNPENDLLGHVVDTGEEAANPHVRRYRTSGDIAFHCDLADAVGLLCLRAARRGGASRIASSVSVYNELLRRRPDLVPRLYEPFLLDARNEEKQAERAARRSRAKGGQEGRLPYFPVPPCRFAAGRLRTFYHSDYFRSVERHASAPRLSEAERTLLDLYEAIADSPELRLDMHFEPGDVQLISNHVVLHARTAYEDDPDPAHRRHLLRLWLSFS